MLVSGGRLVLGDAVPQGAYSATWAPVDGLGLVGAMASYRTIYRRQLWVFVVVRKRALATSRLPLKVYRRSADGRIDEHEHALAELLRQPNPRMRGAQLWEWTSSTYDTYGEALWVKVRPAAGRPPGQLLPLHPANVTLREAKDGGREYVVGSAILAGGDPQLVIPEADVVHFRTYNPDTTARGMSPLEPLRQTLANEDAARRASSAFWGNGGRPAGYLSHPRTIGDDALRRLRAQWNEDHQGVDNFGKWAILEEGMEPKVLSLSAEEAQYVESRKLNREEVCAAYDVPPPVVHILDRATYSNITEQMRSMYRDTMAPHLGGFEEVLAGQLLPDFGEHDLYVEFLLDQVLRGDFEQRVDAYQKGINSGWLKPNEVRRMENLSDVDGGDLAYVNSTLKPIAPADGELSLNDFALAVQKLYLGVGVVISEQEAREALRAAGAPLEAGPVPGKAEADAAAAATQALRSVMGRLGRVTSLDELDATALPAPVIEVLEAARSEGATVDEARRRVRALAATKELNP